MVNIKAIKKIGSIFGIVGMVLGMVLNAMSLQIVRAAENEPIKAIVQYDFNGNFTDSLGGSTLTAFGSSDDGKGHKNSSSSFCTDGGGGDATYWKWTSDSKNGGGFYIDLNKDISEEYSIGVRFSYNLIKSNYTKIIDFKNMTSDNGFYFLGGKLNYYPYNNIGFAPIANDQIVDLIATRSKADKKFIAYIVVNGVLQKEFEVTDNGGYAIPATPNGKPRFGFFFDDYNGEATTGGKVYSLKVWDKPITALDAEKAMDRKPTVVGVAPTTSANNDGKIIKTTTEMEYKKPTDTEWKAVLGTEITGLSTGTYNVRYVGSAGTEVDVFVPALIDIALSGNPSNYTFAGGTYTYNGVTVANSVSSITVTPTGMVGDIKVNGTQITSGTTSSAITLTEGVEKTIIVELIEPGKTTTYTIKVTRAQNSTISPTMGSFDKKSSAQADVVTNVTLNGNGLSAIKNENTVLIEGTDYTTSGSAITIKKEYLATQPVGTINLTFNFSAGNTQTLAITVSDTTPAAPNPPQGSSKGSDRNTSINTVIGKVIDKDGNSVKGVDARVSTETNGTKTVETTAKEAILVKQPDGTKAPLSDISKLSFDVKNNTNVSISADGTIKIKELAKGTETKISICYDLGNGQKIIIGTMDVKVSSNGDVSLTSTLIDPYGTITDAATGKVIEGATVKLYYANTERNKAAGKIADTLVQLPIINGFKPNDNKNPQVSDINGAYGFMVFPTADYYIVATKDEYSEFKSPTIPVEQDIVKLDIKMNKPSTGLNRLSGLNRIDTAIEIAKASYTGKVSNVILASSDCYADALTGSVLAYKFNAPILLVGSSAAEQEKVLAYMKENMDTAGNVYILGGTGVVTSTFEANIGINGFKNITRLGGADRYETSLKIAEKLDAKIGAPIVLANGENYPDALSISSTAAVMQYPIFLVQKDKISDAVKSKLAEIKPIRVYIIGLQGGISSAAEDQVVQTISIAKENIVRIGGVDRYETSLAVAKYFNLTGQNVCIATGESYPDAIAGSVYSANLNSPMILVSGSFSDNAINYLKTRKITGAKIFGGEAVVNKEIEKKLLELIVK